MKARAHLRWIQAATLASVVLLFVSCSREPPTQSYSPGLGEIMTLTQMRHAKLWLAGQAGNWPLASYEIDELEEGFHDAMEYHPTHKGSPLPIKDLIPKMTGVPLEELRNAVRGKDQEAFTQAFDTLTKACNSCHQATNFGFNVVVRPSGNSFVNQDFSVPSMRTQDDR
jgi:hypothetical protein